MTEPHRVGDLWRHDSGLRDEVVERVEERDGETFLFFADDGGSGRVGFIWACGYTRVQTPVLTATQVRVLLAKGREARAEIEARIRRCTTRNGE